MFVTPELALTTALHAIRHKRPEAQIADETGIAPSQIRKYRSGHARPHVDEWPKLIRAIYEVDPVSAKLVAQASLPGELFTATPINQDSARLSVEVLEAGVASGQLQQTFLGALSDGRIDRQELDDIEQAYSKLADESAQGMAAIQKMRNEIGESQLGD